jgi:hypothetical protein
MREVTVQAFEAFDGKRFTTAKECRDYESDGLHIRLANLTPEQVSDALARRNLDLASAFEDAGLIIRSARRVAGDFRIQRKPKAKAIDASVAPNDEGLDGIDRRDHAEA